MKPLLLPGILFAVSALFASCDEEEPTLRPYIASVQQEVSPGDLCTITGCHFGEAPSSLAVRFGDTTAEVACVYDIVAHVYVPYLENRTRTEVSLSVGGRMSNTVGFEAGNAGIAVTGMHEPDGRSVGGFGYDLRIDGRGFHPEPAMNRVRFSDVEAVVREASYSSLTVTIPEPVSFDQTQAEVVVENRVTGCTTEPRVYTYLPNACDSMRVVTAPWVRETLRPGVEYRKASFPLFAADSMQEIHVVEAVLSPENRLGIGFPSEATDFARTSAQAVSANALVGINGGYFTMQDGVLVEYPYVRIDGVEKQEGAPGNSETFRSGVLTFDGDGCTNVRIRRTGTSDQNLHAKELPEPNVLVAGPLLLSDNAPNRDIPGAAATAHNVTAAPRTAIGKTDGGSDNGRMLFVVVDGRRPAEATGMNVFQLQRLLRYLGAQHAMCLDGGGSTTLCIRDKGVVNRPADGEEREVQSTLFLL